MVSPPGLLHANIFMKKLRPCLCNWRRNVDDIFNYALSNKIDLITLEFNSYCLTIRFTYDQESKNKLAFLDQCITRTIN